MKKEGFVRLRRGLLEHIEPDDSGEHRMRDCACRLYVWMLMRADHKTGVVSVGVRDVAEALGWGRDKAARYLAELSARGYITADKADGPKPATYCIKKWNYCPTHRTLVSDPSDSKSDSNTHQSDSNAAPVGQYLFSTRASLPDRNKEHGEGDDAKPAAHFSRNEPQRLTPEARTVFAQYRDTYTRNIGARPSLSEKVATKLNQRVGEHGAAQVLRVIAAGWDQFKRTKDDKWSRLAYTMDPTVFDGLAAAKVLPPKKADGLCCGGHIVRVGKKCNVCGEVMTNDRQRAHPA